MGERVPSHGRLSRRDTNWKQKLTEFGLHGGLWTSGVRIEAAKKTVRNKSEEAGALSRTCSRKSSASVSTLKKTSR